MELYLDLNKAQATQTMGGKTTKKETQSVNAANESYIEHPSGVANDSATYDDPNKGRKWKHGESEDDKLEEERQAANKKAQDQNLVPTPEEVGDVKKAVDSSALDMVKSLTSGLRNTLNLNKLSNSEVEFLHLVKGFSHEEIDKGNIIIAGRDRALFSAFLCEKARLSVDKMYRR